MTVLGDTMLMEMMEAGLAIDSNGIGDEEGGGITDKVNGHLKYNLNTKTLKTIPITNCYLLCVTVKDIDTGESVTEMIPLQAK